MNTQKTERQHWMGVLARAGSAPLEHELERLPEKPAYEFLRRPETGMTMVRGRAGGKGQQFNLGEMTMTRCSVRLLNGAGAVGHGYIAGRNKRHAELAALFDALLQSAEAKNSLNQNFIADLERAHDEKLRAEAQKTAATRVNFFTMVRGED